MPNMHTINTLRRQAQGEDSRGAAIVPQSY